MTTTHVWTWCRLNGRRPVADDVEAPPSVDHKPRIGYSAGLRIEYQSRNFRIYLSCPRNVSCSGAVWPTLYARTRTKRTGQTYSESKVSISLDTVRAVPYYKPRQHMYSAPVGKRGVAMSTSVCLSVCSYVQWWRQDKLSTRSYAGQ